MRRHRGDNYRSGRKVDEGAMEFCIDCGAETATVELLPSYDDDAFGIPITIKKAVLRHRCESCGMDGIEIPDADALEAAVAVARILVPIVLGGHEIRFLRKACGMSGKEFAREMRVDNASLSRWEKCDRSSGDGHGEVTDRRIREVVWGLLCDRTPAIQIPPGHLVRMEIVRGELPRLVFERVRLKDQIRHTKSDAWDIDERAA